MSLARRFRAAYLSLAALFGAAVGFFVVLERRPAPVPPPPWSTWKPTAGSMGERQQQIANHVGALYHLQNGKLLVSVLAGGPPPASNPVRSIAIARTLDPKKQSDLITQFDTSKTAMFILCGDGPNCSIGSGKTSTARGKVVGREALELALYTFRYIGDASSVVTFVPPAKGKSPSQLLLFSKTALEQELKRPLRTTLPAAKAPRPGQLSPRERKVVDTLTGPRLFRFRLVEDSSGARLLILAPNRR